MDDLVFEPSVGRRPEPGSLEEEFLIACSQQDQQRWDELCNLSRHELIEVVHNLRRMGWRFHLVTVH